MNKKKISIVIISVLAFIIILCVALFLYSKNNQNLESSDLPQNEVIPNDVVENTTDIQTAEVQEENNAATVAEEQKGTQTIPTQEESNTSNKPTETKPQVASEKQNNKPVETKPKATTQVETKKVETPKNTENKSTVTSTTETSKKEEIKEDSKPTQTTTPANTEKYVRNDEMINKIRGVMQNNESDFMKQYGYNIVVDSSIKEQTNQFTYTESRVINYLKYKFGTIRIYAEDYYKNGNLIMTMCYIL